MTELSGKMASLIFIATRWIFAVSRLVLWPVNHFLAINHLQIVLSTVHYCWTLLNKKGSAFLFSHFFFHLLIGMPISRCLKSMSQSTTAKHFKNISNKSPVLTCGRKEATSLKLGHGQKVNNDIIRKFLGKGIGIPDVNTVPCMYTSKVTGKFKFCGHISGRAKPIRGLTKYVLLPNKWVCEELYSVHLTKE